MNALYLQQAVCLLPDLPSNAAELETLAGRIRQFEGEATLLRTLAQSEEWERRIESQMQSARDSMYEKLREEIEKFVDEIRFEEHRKRFTVEELEELEQKFEALQRWFDKLKKQQAAESRMSKEVKADLKDASIRLEKFATKVEQYGKTNG